MKLVALQVEDGVDEVLSRVEEVAESESADLLVLPERPFEEVPRHGGPVYDRLLGVTEALDAVVVGPALERGRGLAAPVVHKGRELGLQGKLHLYGEEREEYAAEPLATGSPKAVDTPVGRVGVAVCFDADFPEFVRRLALDGAEVLAVPAWIPEGGLGNWHVYLKARALENRLPVVAANGSGEGGSVVIGFGGGSRSPVELEVAEAGAEDDYVSAEVDTGWAGELRDGRMGENRLLEMYGSDSG